MSVEITQLMTSLKNEFVDFKTINDNRLKEIESKSGVSAETKAQFDLVSEKMDRLESKLRDELSAKKSTDAVQIRNEQKAEFNEWARAKSIETKLMSVDSNPDGGFSSPDFFSGELIRKIYEQSPMMQLASVKTFSVGSAWEGLVEDGQPDSEWSGERSPSENTQTLTHKLVRIQVNNLTAEPRITKNLIEDSAINIEAEIASQGTAQMIRKANTAFVSGDGSGKPFGLLSTTGITTMNSGSATAFTMDNLIRMSGQVKDGYNLTWGWNRLTNAFIRSLKGTDNYFWEPNLQNGAPSTFLGLPVAIFADLANPNATTFAFADGNIPVVIGDFSRGYYVAMKNGISIERNPFKVSGQVLYEMTLRLGGQVVNKEAFAFLKTATL